MTNETQERYIEPIERLVESEKIKALTKAEIILKEIKPNGYFEGREDEKITAEDHFNYIEHQLKDVGSRKEVYGSYLEKLFESERLPEEVRQRVLTNIKDYESIVYSRVMNK